MMYVTAYFTGLHLSVHYISVNCTEVCAFVKTLSLGKPTLPVDVKTAINLKPTILKYEHYMLFVQTRILAMLHFGMNNKHAYKTSYNTFLPSFERKLITSIKNVFIEHQLCYKTSDWSLGEQTGIAFGNEASNILIYPQTEFESYITLLQEITGVHVT